MKDWLLYFIVTVTGYHTHVGNVGDYLIDPSICTSKLREGVEISDIQTHFQVIFHIQLFN